ncbi:MAG: arsenate reductase (glutaredoxin) [Aliivibrio sp.]|uniref:arsenate reductase (glutaredoxin) n=1 Tax=Aliivibrio sp. TaxID=1872443 RepID=UPI001A53D626|nr:arsenate reductase (glutaredoxin) [Aliivibrio sp.]
MDIVMYHNPSCSKSRQTLSLLEEHGVAPTLVLYLETIPSIDDLKSVYAQLGFTTVRSMMRTKEDQYKTLNLKDDTLTDLQLFTAMHNCPKLIERPIVIANNQAKIGRPPEQVLAIL